MNDVERFDYDLPRELIAQNPPDRRGSSRLLVIDRARGCLVDSEFQQLPDYLKEGDVLVANDSRVMPARLHGHLDTGGRVELLLIRRHSGESAGPQTSTDSPAPGKALNSKTPEMASPVECWEVMARPARKLRVGRTVQLADGMTARIEAVRPEGRRVVSFRGSREFLPWLHAEGRLPLPPYIKEHAGDPGRYQTVYAEREGSVAAPTAGLHFTPEILSHLEHKGIELRFVTLHVGPGTFKTVDITNMASIQLEPEWGTIDERIASAITKAKAEKRRVIAVGTTTTRLLEGLYLRRGQMCSWSGEIDLLIKPPYEFKLVDALITNFHLPRSTLLMLVSAFAGEDLIRDAYAHAIRERYRFYSFGDAMLIR